MPIVAAFPNAVAAFTDKFDLTDVVFAAHINALQAEVVALETILGTLPQGTAATVKARIQTLEASITTLSGRFDSGGQIPQSGVTGLIAALAGKSLTGHTHVDADITDLGSANVYHALLADNATHATNADFATNAGHATNADSATNAGHATNADSATNAGHATSADSATSVSSVPWADVTGKPLTTIKGGVLTRAFVSGALTIAHGLGATPQSAAVTTISGGGTNDIVMLNGPIAFDGTNIYLRAVNVAASTNFSGTITFAWIAFA